MIKNLNKELKQYYHEIEQILSCDKKEKKGIITSIKTNVEAYILDNPNLTFKDITDHFGSSKDIAQEYYNSEKVQELFSNVKNRKKIAIGMFVTAIVAFMLLTALFVSQIHADSGYNSFGTNQASKSDVSH